MATILNPQSGSLAKSVPVGSTSENPQFEPAVRPWIVVALVVLSILLVIGCFVYGQISPGA